MEGLWIAPADRRTWPGDDRATPFVLCFEPVFDQLRPLHWYASSYESGPFDFFTASQIRREEDLDALFLDIPNERGNVQVGAALLRSGFLPELAAFLYQDWIELVGVGGNEDYARTVAEEFLDLHWQSRVDDRYSLMEQHGEICFFCVDGSSWEIYARDEEILDRVARHVQDRSGILVQRRTLRERDSQS